VTSLGRADHIDAVAVDLPAGTTATAFVLAALADPPAWIRTLMRARDALVRPFGLKTQTGTANVPVSVVAGSRFGPFRVLSVTSDEVLLGDDDRHLRFRTSFAVRPRSGGAEGVCTTVVAHENAAGRIYFFAIRPFHHAIVAALAARAGARCPPARVSTAPASLD
jgi:hypothetical protein